MDKDLRTSLEDIKKRTFAVLAPDPELKVSEWAERFRVLPRESSAEPGRWRNDRTPYLVAIMDSFNDPEVEEIVMEAAAQVGKSELLLNVIGYNINRGKSQLIVLPAKELCESFSKDRIAPMISGSKRLSQLVQPPKSRDSSNTIYHKTYAGGQLTLVSTSVNSVSSRPVPIVIVDEVDRVGSTTEGDTVNLAKKRSSTFYDKKLLATSTPTDETSRVHHMFEHARRNHFEVPCLHCKNFIPLLWDNVRWDEDDPETAHYVCQTCGEKVTDVHKRKMLPSGRWVCDDPDRPKRRMGFHISALYSPWVSFEEIVREYLESRGDSNREQVFQNTYLGEVYTTLKQGVPAISTLYLRREDYIEAVPRDVLVLTCGVDVQEDRVEYLVTGYGEYNESWVIDYGKIWGDPSREDFWLNDVLPRLSREYPHELGFKMPISATCIDSGGRYTHEVYRFCYGLQTRRIFAVKGVGGTGRAIVGAPSRARMGRNKRGCLLHPIGVDEAKTLVYQRLKVPEPGPGYIHFPKICDQEFFKQLTAERVRIIYKQGFPTKKWELITQGAANEMLDCFVYSLSALTILNPAYDQIKYVIAQHEKTDRVMAAHDEEREDPRRFMRRQKKPSGGFVNSW